MQFAVLCYAALGNLYTGCSQPGDKKSNILKIFQPLCYFRLQFSTECFKTPVMISDTVVFCPQLTSSLLLFEATYVGKQNMGLKFANLCHSFLFSTSYTKIGHLFPINNTELATTATALLQALISDHCYSLAQCCHKFRYGHIIIRLLKKIVFMIPMF